MPELDARLIEIRRIISDLPQANADLLQRMAEHLDKCVIKMTRIAKIDLSARVSEFEEFNQMTVEALAIVFSPNLLRTSDFGLLLSNMGHANKLVKALITHVCYCLD